MIQVGQLIDQGHFAEAQSVAVFHLAEILELEEPPSYLPDVYVQLAFIAMQERDLALATQHFDTAFEWLDKGVGVPSIRVGALNGRAVAARYGGDLDAAIGFLEQARVITAAEGHVGASAALLGNMAAIAREIGDDERALTYAKDAIAGLEADGGPDNPQLATPLMTYASMVSQDGRYYEAVAILDRAELLVEQGKRWALQYVRAGALKRGGDLVAALEGMADALVSCEAFNGDGSPECLAAREGLAEVQADVGDLDRARAGYERALEIAEAKSDGEVRVVADLRMGLGTVLMRGGDYDAAIALTSPTCELLESTFGPDHADANECRLVMSVILGNADKSPEALIYATKALDSYRRSFGERHRLTASALAIVGELLLRNGRTEEALDAMRSSLEINAEHYGRPLPADAQALGMALWANGDLPGARSLVSEQLHHTSETVLDLAPWLSEREQLALVHSSRRGLDLYLSLFDGPEDSVVAYQWMLDWKGSVQRTLARRRVPASGTPEVVALHDELDIVRRRIAVKTWDLEADPETRAASLTSLTEAKDALERKLASGEVERSVTFEELCRALPGDVALVDFLRYDLHAPADSGLVEDAPAYLAFVVTNDCVAPTRVPLGLAATIDELVARYRSFLDDPETADARLERAGDELRALVVDPLMPALGARSSVIIAPDGPLSGLSFAALPLEDGRWFIERYRLRYVEAAGELLRPHSAAGRGAVLVGGVTYGGAAGTDRPGSPCSPGNYADLPGTVREVAGVDRSFRKRHAHEVVQVLGGGDATEPAIVSALPGRRLIHLATHGFFASGDCGSAMASTEARRVVGYNPMVLSGVVVAPSESSDAILTAEELAGLDLRGVELVVLSACETGLGTVRSGDGVLGLRRGFSMAGVQNLIMSLWNVEDDATQKLMARFYFGYLKKQWSAADALRAAQLEMLEDDRKAGISRPQNWAAFVAAGGSE